MFPSFCEQLLRSLPKTHARHLLRRICRGQTTACAQAWPDPLTHFWLARQLDAAHISGDA